MDDIKLHAAYTIGKLRSKLWVNPMFAMFNIFFGMSMEGTFRYINFGFAGLMILFTILDYFVLKHLISKSGLDEEKLAKPV